MRSAIGDPSVMLWLASALVTFLAGRAFAEYLRRLVHEGPWLRWRELVLGSLALAIGVWGAMVLDISAQGLSFELGFHPLKIFGALVAAWVAIAAMVAALTYRPRWYTQLAAAPVLAIIALVVQVSAVWAIGAEPGLFWRREPLLFSALMLLVGFGVSGRMVAGVRRGSKGDRSSRRLLAALILGACCVASQELVLAASGLDRQVVSAYARLLPEVAVMLIAGALVPVGLVLMLVDQRAQQRARASQRARRKHAHARYPEAGGDESMFADSIMSPGLSETTRSTRS